MEDAWKLARMVDGTELLVRGKEGLSMLCMPIAS